MSKKVRIWLWIGSGSTILVAAVLIGNLFKPQPANINLGLPSAVSIKTAITRMYELEDSLICVPGTSIDSLSTILVDTPDYQPTFQEIKTIVQVFGLDGLTHAGFLTAKQAYYQVRLNPPKSTPPPGLIPTQPPVMYCSGPPFQIELTFKSITLESADKAIANYYYVNGDYEAVLRNIGGKWRVSGTKLIRWYGNG